MKKIYFNDLYYNTIQEKEIQKLQAKYYRLVKECKPMQANVVMQQIQKAKLKQVPLKSLLPEMTDEERKEALRLMHLTFIHADLLESAAIEFENYLNKFGKMELLITREVREIARRSHKLIENVDSMNDDKLSQDFGDMCDECSLVVSNIINKYRARK